MKCSGNNSAATQRWSPSRWRQLRVPIGVLAAALLLFPNPARTRLSEAPEYSVKAGYLLLFTRYVEWPPVAFDSPQAPLEIMIVGADPFGEVLDKTVAGAISQERPVVVRRASQPNAEVRRAHLLFIARGDSRLQRQWLEAVADAPVLTVVEDEDVFAGGGVVALVEESQGGKMRVRFDVSLPAMQRAGLKIHSQMLSAARNLVRQAEPTARQAER